MCNEALKGLVRTGPFREGAPTENVPRGCTFRG